MDASEPGNKDEGAQREGSIFIEHDLTRGPVTAVKAMLLQFSLAQLENHGYLDRYVDSMGQDKLQHLRMLAATDWVPVELVLEHYGACDQLGLTRSAVARVAGTVGGDVERRSYVSYAKKARSNDFDLWTETPALHRIGHGCTKGEASRSFGSAITHGASSSAAFP